MDPVIRTLKARHPLEQVAARFVRLRRSGKYLVGRCPFHPDRTPSFAVDARRGRWRCFGRCATSWLDVIDFIGWLRHGVAWNAHDPAMFKEAMRELGELSSARCLVPSTWQLQTRETRGVTRNTPDAQMLLDRVAAIYRARLWATGAAPGTPLADLHGRGFADDTIRRAKLGYCAGDEILKYLRQNRIPMELARSTCLIDPERGDREFLRGRIVFPDFDRGERVLCLAGRKWAKALGPRSPKYLVLKGSDKPLYGWARLDKAACDRPVFVTESLPDGLTLTQWGLDALVTLGTVLKESHVRLITALLRPLVYVPHNDGGTGLAAAHTWRAAVGRGQILPLPDRVKDLNELALIPGGRQTFAAACAELVQKAPAGV